jgi:adenosylcobinamide-phosphate synthase
MERVEQALWADRRSNGVAYALSGVAIGAAAGVATGSTVVATWSVAAGRELRRRARHVGEVVGTGDLAAARAELPSLVGRDPSELDASGIAAAVIESVAENSVDAVIAPAFWAAVAGGGRLPGDQHHGRDGRKTQREVRELRLGCGSP